MAHPIVLSLVILLSLAVSAAAQEVAQGTNRYLNTGLVDTGGGTGLFIGGGGGRQLSGGPAIAGEAALVFYGDRERSTLVSLTAGRFFLPPRFSFQPFLQGGIALVGASFGWTAGGGGTYWLGKRTGFRVEARLVAPFQGEGRLIVATAGIAFR